MIGDFRAQRAERQALETVEPTIVSPPAPEMRVLVYSNTGLPEQEFRAQTEKLRQVASFDSDSRRGDEHYRAAAGLGFGSASPGSVSSGVRWCRRRGMIVGLASEAVGFCATCAAYQRL
jgi:hypothetical protein